MSLVRGGDGRRDVTMTDEGMPTIDDKHGTATDATRRRRPSLRRGS